MNCPVAECVSHQECFILEITNGSGAPMFAPKDANSCSYFKSQKKLDKEKKKFEEMKEKKLKKNVKK
jgi:hypothetical protein